MHLDAAIRDAIFFRVLLSNRASKRDRLLRVTQCVSDQILRAIEPLEQWGLLPYCDYRSQSEQAALKEKAWA